MALGSPGGAFTSPGRPVNGGRFRRRLPPRPMGVGFGSRLGSDIRRRAPRPLSPRPRSRGACSDSLCARFAPTRLRLRLCAMCFAAPLAGDQRSNEHRAGGSVVSIEPPVTRTALRPFAPTSALNFRPPLPFANLAPIGIAEHTVTYQRRIPPCIFRGALTCIFAIPFAWNTKTPSPPGRNHRRPLFQSIPVA